MKKLQDADAVLSRAISENSNNVTYDMIERVYRQTGTWPRIDRVQSKVYVRGLTNGFLLLSSDEVENAKNAKQQFIDVSITHNVFLVLYDSRKNIVDVWGPDQDVVRSTMLAVLRIVRGGKKRTTGSKKY